MNSGFMPFVFEPRYKRKAEVRVVREPQGQHEDIILLRDMTGVQCERCGTPYPEPHRDYCFYNWKCQDVFMD